MKPFTILLLLLLFFLLAVLYNCNTGFPDQAYIKSVSSDCVNNNNAVSIHSNDAVLPHKEPEQPEQPPLHLFQDEHHVFGREPFETRYLARIHPTFASCVNTSVISAVVDRFCRFRHHHETLRLWRLGIALFHTEDELIFILQHSHIIHTRLFMDTELEIMKWNGDGATEEFGIKEQAADTYHFKDHKERDALGTYLDLGGHIGLAVMNALSINPRIPQIVIFEPTPVNYFYLRWNLYWNGFMKHGVSNTDSSNTNTNIIPLNAGVGGTHNNLFTINWFAGDSTGSSEYVEDTGYAQGKIHRKEAALSVPLARIIHQYNITRIGIVKLDCEGCERGLVDEHSLGILRSSTRICGELHPWLMNDTNDMEQLKQALCTLTPDTVLGYC
jgi:FkbM family methyltransferase